MNEYNEIIVTLYEGHYHYGVAALINSIVKSGFKGLIHIGYRGNLPTWVQQLQIKNDIYFFPNKEIFVQFEAIESKTHFGYYKPFFLHNIFNKYNNSVKVFYFDPDIVINAPWFFFSSWVECGVALCLDNCFPFVHHNHPWRNSWRKLALADMNNKVDFYVNSGFIGLCRQDNSILLYWIRLTELYQNSGGVLTSFEVGAHKAIKTDQDLLNAAITISDNVKFSIIGTEGMGFTQPAYIMTHAVNDAVKPWKRNFIKQLIIKGNKPIFSDRNFFNYCDSPILVFSKRELLFKKLNLQIASILGRIIG